MREGVFQLRVVGVTALWFAATLSTTGCLFTKKPRAYVPPVIRPPVRVTLKPPPLILDPAPQVEVALVELPEAAPTNPAPLPPPAKPAPPRPRPVAQTPKPPPPPPDALPTLPRITQILTAQETRDYNREIDTDLSRSTEVLKTAGKKNLTADQRDIVERIVAFQKQAVQAREEDLVTAVNYARRAEVLATDLLAHLP
jgi:hypothetical protein